MVTNEKVMEIFKDYLIEDSAVEIVQTTRGLTYLLWESRQQIWSEATWCPTPKLLFDTLLESLLLYKGCQMSLESGGKDLSPDQLDELKTLKGKYLMQYETVQSENSAIHEGEL